MSRFFAAGSSSSEDEDEYVRQVSKPVNRFGAFFADSEEEEDEDASGMSSEQSGFSTDDSEDDDGSEGEAVSGDEEEEEEDTRRNRFLFGSDDEDDSDEEGQRQVKSAKEKAEEEFEAICDLIEEGMDGKDWLLVQGEYEKLLKMMGKQGKYLTEVVFDTIRLIETVTSETSAEEKKKMSGADAKAFNAVRQKNKKTMGQYAGQLERPSSGAAESLISGKADLSKEEAAALASSKVIEMTPENVLRKLQEVVGSRGRKHADKQENMVVLRKLYELAKDDAQRIQVLVGTVAAQFDMTVPSIGHLSAEQWTEAIRDTERLLELLSKGDAPAKAHAEAEELGLPGLVSLEGSLFSFIQRLDDEFVKALQMVDPHTSDYEEFLAAEGQMYELLARSTGYFVGKADWQHQITLRQLEHIYFRPTSAFADEKTVVQLCGKLYGGEVGEKIRVRALLCHVYHLALHGQYTRAKQIFLASHISDHLASLEVSTQILYNRTVVQLGLAAFQRGLLKESYHALQEICSSGRPRELLAQGVQSQRYSERTPEQERAERQRQLPSHLHISIELIDSVFLTASMLLEIPQAAAASRRFYRGDRKLFPSRHLRRFMDGQDRNLFNGPPENTRDHIISAAKALANGHWRECLDLTRQSRLWALFPTPEAVEAMLERKVKESALCAFILAFAPTYTSLSTASLAASFELEESLVVQVIERLIQDHGLPARLQDSFMVWMQQVELSPIQELVLQIKDKLAVLSERNNECLDVINRPTHA